MSDAYIDPATGGYTIADGAPLRDPAAGLANAVYLRLMTPLGTYWEDPTVGSQLHKLRREKDLARISVLAAQYAEQALAPIIKDGRATEIEVAVERQGNGRLNLLIVVTAASGERLTFRHPITVL